MRRHAVIETEEDILAHRAAAVDAKRARAVNATRRKDRMMALEESRRAAVPLTQLQREEMTYRSEVRKNAHHLQDEALDEVKQMNAYMQYAVTAMVRERQVAEKKERKELAALADKIKDMETEIVRLESLKARVDRERTLVANQKQSRAVIEVQMAERQRERAKRSDVVKAEEKEVTAMVKQQEVEDRERRLRTMAEKKVLREEVLAANEAALAAKRTNKAREIEEDQALFEWQQAKALEAEEAEAEGERKRAVREFEFAKLRAAQEKVSDNRGALDELRAKRAFEAAERKHREHEQAAALRKAEQQRDINRQRERQMSAKEMQLALEIQREKAEFEENQHVQREYLQAEDAQRKRRDAANAQHRTQLASMVSEGETRVRQARLVEAEEGKGYIKERDERITRVRAIRDQKVAQLQEMGVHSKYTSQLKRVDPMTALLKDYKMGPQAGTKLRGS
jgi:hypothetical protein